MLENQLSIKILEDNKKSYIPYTSLKWVKKKDLKSRFENGDLIFVKQKQNFFELKQYPDVNGAIVVIDPYNGKVRALVDGGFSFISSEFNRATQAKRQPGSAFKPFVYAAALENNYLPNSIVLDAPFIAEQGIGLKD